jgi:ribonuclease R
MKEQIVAYLSSEPHKKATIEELRDVLHVSSSDEIKAFMKAINELLDEAILIEGPNHNITTIENTNYMVGRLDLKARGFGFVIPEDPSYNDVFVPKDNLNGAMNHDTVLVHVSAGYGARQEGHIKRVLERKYTHIIGTVLEGKKNALLQPDDPTIQSNIFIQPKNLFGAKENDKVWAKILNYSYKGKIECKVDQILGNINDPGIDILSKVLQYNIDPIFPEEVIQEAKDVSVVRKEDYEGRRDLRKLPYITIDGDDAKDFDDAVYVTIDDKGNYILGVSIADVSHYVKTDSILDKEAFRRGTSIYLADRVIPMLPEELSNDICSLRPHVDRLTITCEMVINPAGKVLRYDIYPSVIHSSYRMTYNKVNEIYNGDPDLAEEYVEIVGMLYQMRNLAKTLTKKREQVGSIQFDTQESYFTIDEFGRTVDVQPRTRGISETIIEEFMLLANKTVAEHIHWMDLPFIYRIHEKPSEEKLGRLINMASALGYQIKGKSEVSHHELQKLVDHVHGTDMEQGINLLMLRSMQKAIYSEVNIGHYGLAFDYYTHFTSPIRRYPDLIVHRLLRTYLFKGDVTKSTVDHYRDTMHDIATRSSKTERTAVMLERDVADMKKAEYISAYIGKQFDGIISSVTSFGLYVSLPNTVEGLVHISNLNDDYYHYAPDLMMLVGERTKTMYKVGDHVTIKVMGATIIDGDVDFKIVKRGESSETRRPK